MQSSLFLLILMGQSSFFTCHLYKYHFIQEKMTWTDAQKYCRVKHTDLATVFDKTDIERLRTVANNQDRVWIGLYKNGTDRKWHWSLPGVEFRNKTMWDRGEPNDAKVPENCVWMTNSKWHDVPCHQTKTFICYDEHKESNDKIVWIKETKTWLQAQNYCREHHTDLISGSVQLEELNGMTKDQRWIGLFRDSWKWSDESSSSFRHWDQSTYKKVNVETDNKSCVASILSLEGRWSFGNCSNVKPFFCYDVQMILIQKNMTWVEALYYCRENYYDLVSITNHHQQIWVQNRAKNRASTSHVWLGLRYTCTLDFWFWVSDERVSYTNWASDGRNDSCDMSAAMESGGDHKWYTTSDDNKFNFICALE